MNTEGLHHEFVYEGTEQGVVDYLWQLTQNQNAKIRARLIPWKETYPYPDIHHRTDGTPFFVEYTVSRTIPITDPADGQQREASEYLPGVSFELNPLRGGNTNVIARCHNQALEDWYFHVLEQFGVHPEAAPTPAEILKQINEEAKHGTTEWWNALFSWFELYKNQGFRFTQPDLANLSGYSVGHVKRKLSEWRKEFGP
jgi:hypothetical protein